MNSPTPTTVSELMTRDVVSLAEDDNLLNLLSTLQALRFRHLPVTASNRLVGLVTERDLLAASTSSLLPHRTSSDHLLQQRFSVRDIMVRNVVTASPETSISDAAELLLKHRFGCLPIVDAENELVGIVTSSDFIRLAAEAKRGS
jgi:CBS domain-containing membrane protein